MYCFLVLSLLGSPSLAVRDESERHAIREVVIDVDKATSFAKLKRHPQMQTEGMKDIMYWSDDMLVVESPAKLGQPRKRLLSLMTPHGAPVNGRYAYASQTQGGIYCSEPSAETVGDLPKVSDNQPWMPCFSAKPCSLNEEIEGTAAYSDREGWLTAQIANLRHAPAGPADGSPRLLQLGLGAGLMTRWLSAKLPLTSLDVVDVSQQVVDVAPCNGIPASNKLRYHVKDARSFLETSSPESYDVILFDVNSEIPCLRTVEFWQHAYNSLAPGGLLSVNTIAFPDHRVAAASVMKVFGNVEFGQSKHYGNEILRANKVGRGKFAAVPEGSPLSIMLDTWAQEARYTSQELRVDAAEHDADICHG